MRASTRLFRSGNNSRTRCLAGHKAQSCVHPSSLHQTWQVADTVQQECFLEVLATEGVDAIAVMAHMDVKDPLVTTILTAIRAALGDDIDVIFLTGHTHYRGYVLALSDMIY